MIGIHVLLVDIERVLVIGREACIHVLISTIEKDRDREMIRKERRKEEG